MPRIRSVKPEFASDEDILELSDSCALFFVLLWNHCDDEGKIKNDPKSISKKVCRWNREKVQLFISSLLAKGQLRVSSCSAWIQVTGWSHQRINRPIQPKVKASEIQWFTKTDSVSTQLHVNDHSPQGEERIGEDRIGTVVDAKIILLIDFLKGQVSWHESIAARRKIPIESVPDRIDEFQLHLKAQQKVPANQESFGHFDNWLRIQLDNEQRTTKSSGSHYQTSEVARTSRPADGYGKF